MTATRRQFLASALAVAALAPLSSRALACLRFTAPEAALLRVRDLEQRHGVRLGVSLLDLASGQRFAHRGDERFPMCSTFKLLLAAQVLARADRGEDRMDRRVVFGAQDLVSWSPVTEKHLGAPGLSLAELCEATVTISDNTAANLLLAQAGGPEGFTAFVRTLGDEVTRLDRIEPELNESAPGDPRDTTTPDAMLASMRAVLLGGALSAGAQRQLEDWLVATRTGDKRLRAGLPADWRVGDKTGTSGNGIANDIAIARVPGRGVLLVTAYLDAPALEPAGRDAILAEVGTIAAEFVAAA
jgi:beta-lactamase class A